VVDSIEREAPFKTSFVAWKKASRSLLYLSTFGLGLMFLFPYFYTLMSSFKQPWEMYVFPPRFLPETIRWQNYIETITKVPFLRWMYNTLIIAFLHTTGLVFTSSLTAFSFARFRYRFRDTIFLITLSTMMLPAQVTLIPRYVMFFKFGEWTGVKFIDTFRPLWLPVWFGGSAFAIFLMRQFMMTIPRELDDAALIDGADYFRIFWGIVLPLCKPAIATLTLISVMGQWNSFLAPLIYINDPQKFPIAVGVAYFQDSALAVIEEPQEHLLMCAAVLATILPIILFFSFQKQFVRGVVMSGIKG